MHATIGAAVGGATDRLRGAGSPTPRLDAELMLGHAIGRDRSWLLAHPEADSETDAFEAMVERRAAGEPVAYIRGFKEWHSLRILTDARALIPRPETELLADAAIDEIRRRLAGGPVVAWDVATGSGAVALAIGTEVHDPRLTLIASDISVDALALAALNLHAHGVASAVRLERADLLDADQPPPDVLVANLPYVSSAEVDSRVGSLGYEPRVALDGGADGLDLLRRLLREVPTRAAAGATVLLEIGVGQVPAVRALAPEGASVTVVPDLAGLDRVVRIEMPTLAR